MLIRTKFNYLLILLLGVMSVYFFFATPEANYSHSPQEIIDKNPHSLLAEQLNIHQGKVIYLDFWASWCVPCRKSFPWMEKMQAKYAKEGFTVISINLDADKTLAEAFLKNTPSNFPVIYDPQGHLSQEFKIKGMPSSYIFNRAGEIVEAHTGFFIDKTNDYENKLISLLSH